MRIFVSSIHNLHCQTCKEEEGKIEKKSMQTCPAAVLAKSLKWHHFLHGKGDKYLKGLRNFFYAPFLLGLNRRMACKSPSVCSRDIFQSIWYISNCTDPPPPDMVVDVVVGLRRKRSLFISAAPRRPY